MPLATSAQDDRVKIEDFIIEHEGFEENDAGEITPINIKEINKKIRFFVEERYPEIAEFTRNIIWDSYRSFLSSSDIYHYHSFIAQVKVFNLDRLKYVEVRYNPFVKKVTGDFEWIAEDEEFYLVDEKEEKNDNAPDLIDLSISNQEQKPGLEDFIAEHQGFLDVMESKNLKLCNALKNKGNYDIQKIAITLPSLERLIELPEVSPAVSPSMSLPI